MALPDISMRELLEAGIHFGHQKHRWNPKMAPYIFGARNNVHIIDLAQTVPHLYRALKQIQSVVASGGRVLFVGTKRQASQPIAEAAKRCGQYYVDHRWLGGMLTNWKTISHSIKKLKELDEKLGGDTMGITKKEMLQMTRHRDKLERSLGGIREMGGIPDIIFVVDTNREELAIAEAKKLNIPVVGILDTNCDPDGIAFPVPGNDDASRAIKYYCDIISATVLDGLQEELGTSGVDVGAMEQPVAEVAKAEPKAKAKAEPKKAEAKKAEPKAEAKKAEPKKAEAKKAEPKKA
ncbi:MAG: 30S ribosomal protein S2, partial [Sphingomonadales bacterium]|nr:30S ribosomal protein S2 [Sphingomonadales bacterium]